MKQLRNINKETKRLADEIITFYISELTLAEINNLLRILELENKELLPQDQSTLSTLRTTATKQIEQIFNWIREYLVFAVASELKHQYCLPKKGSVEIPKVEYPKELRHVSKVGKFLMLSTEAQIQSFLIKAATRFRQKGWSSSYGGRKWATIAQIAGEMWVANDLNSKCLLIDRTFQIEHNGGMIFDKRPSKIRSDEYEDKRILNIKRKSRDIETLLKNLKRRATGKETKILITRFVETLIKLKQSKLKPVLGGD